MTRHLRMLGHRVAVVTTSSAGRVDGEVDVVRAPDVLAIPALRGLLGAPRVPAPDDPPAGYVAPTLHQRILVPDPRLVGWAPSALLATLRVLRSRPVDCLVTTSPFESTHLVGLALGARRPPWVADFQDGWTFEPWKDPLPLRMQRRLDGWLERQVLTHADATSALPRRVALDLRNRSGRAAYHVTDGWDPELEEEVSSSGRWPAAAPGRVRLVYTGTLWKTVGQDPSPIFAALRRLRDEDRALCARFEFLVAGPLSEVEARRLGEFGLGELVRHVGHVGRAEAVALQRTADALLLFGSRARDISTGKIFEYLVAGRPIVALADDDEVAAIVRETGTGVVVAHDDEARIMRVLRDVASGELVNRYRAHGLARYRYPAPAVGMLGVIEAAIASATRGGSRGQCERRW